MEKKITEAKMEGRGRGRREINYLQVKEGGVIQSPCPLNCLK